MKKKVLPSKKEARAIYESSRLSHRGISEHFREKGYSVSHKTIEKWCADEKWIKDSYSSYELALLAGANKNLESGEKGKEGLDALLRKNIISELALNLKLAKAISDESDSMTSKKIYQEMLLKIYDRTQDEKDCGINLNTEQQFTNEEINKMTQEQLIELSRDLE